ncbi:HNH endonuclease [Lacrimispora sp.]|uniref:HNH endonuclease n=1 Tax=Lacrimispora sp. TaxID=2719234 RepID=UPI003991D66F
MGFDPGISIGDELTNDEMRTLFKCGNMGGMRRSKKTGTLVIISDDTKGLYRDEWKNGVLHYTGMGKIGDQVLEGNQNGTLYYSDTNGIDIHLFEVMNKSIYTYRGVVKLVDKPYQSMQPDDNGNMRKVWMFPVKPISNVDELIELSEREISRLSNRELNRRSQISQVERKPQRKETTIYYRNPYLKEIIKRIAEGKCQYCGNEAPFYDKNNKPYLEEHHVKRLADGGTDTLDNVVAVCPNCHRKMHVLNEETDMIILEGIAAQNENRLKRLMAYEREVRK